MQRKRRFKMQRKNTSKKMVMKFQDRCKAFFTLLEQPKILQLLQNDICCVFADRYNLASVFLFFFKANFELKDYNIRNFFLALHLSHDLNEEVQYYKDDIIEYYVGKEREDFLDTEYMEFMEDRFLLFIKMDFKGNIYKQVCDYIFHVSPHPIWDRIRSIQHSGAFIEEPSCKICMLNSN